MQIKGAIEVLNYKPSCKQLDFEPETQLATVDVTDTPHYQADSAGRRVGQYMAGPVGRLAYSYSVRAEIRLGEMLLATKPKRAKGARKAGTKRGTTRLPDVTASEPTLDELGITKRESSRSQQLVITPK